jgi:hypothetical protein
MSKGNSFIDGEFMGDEASQSEFSSMLSRVSL